MTVAVVSPSSPTLEKDVNTWSARVGTPPLKPGQLDRVASIDDSPEEPFNVGMLENTLDIEAVHGIAPDARIISVGMSTARNIPFWIASSMWWTRRRQRSPRCRWDSE